MPPQKPPAADGQTKASVFITYAREDRAFVFKLRDRLEAGGLEVRGDWQLQTGADYEEMLRSFILRSDGFVFVISPESIQSTPCKQELALAVAQKKRILPVSRRDHKDDDLLDSALRAPHWTFLRDEDKFDDGARGLIEAVKTDPELTDMHSRLLVDADDWQVSGRNKSYLLRKDSLKEAEAWLAKTSEHPDKLPQPTPLQLEFIFAGQSARSRGSRIAFGVASAVILILFGITLFAVYQARAALIAKYYAQTSATEARRRLADLLEEQGRQESLDGDPQLALLYLSRALEVGGASPRLRLLLAQAGQRFEGQTATMIGHRRDVNGAAFSPDGKLVVTASEDRTARVWEAATGNLLHTLRSDEGAMTRVHFSPDGRRVITEARPLVSDADVTPTALWDTQTGALVESMSAEHTSEFRFTADGRRFVQVEGWEPTVRDTATGKELSKIQGHREGVLSAALDDQTGRTLSADTSKVVLRDAGGAEVFSFAPRGIVVKVFFNAGGARLVTSIGDDGTGDRTILLWDAQAGTTLASVTQKTAFREVPVSPDGGRLAVRSRLTFTLLDAVTGAELSSASLPEEEGFSVPQLSPDLNRVARFSDSTVKVFKTADGAPVSRFEVVGGEIETLALSSDGSRVFTVTADNVGRLWAPDEATPAKVFGFDADASAAAFDSGGDRIIVTKGYRSDRSARVAVRDAADGRTLGAGAQAAGRVLAVAPDGRRHLVADRTAAWIHDTEAGAPPIPLEAPGCAIELALFSPDGRRLAASCERQPFVIWDAASGRRTTTLRGAAPADDPEYSEDFVDLRFSPDGTRLVTLTEVSDEGSIMNAKVWDAATGNPITPSGFAFGGSRHDEVPAISRDNRRLVTVSGAASANTDTPHVWDATDDAGGKAKPLFALEGHTEHVTSIAFNPAQNLIVTASSDTSAKVWDAANGGLIVSLEGHRGAVESASFSPDGEFVVTAGRDNTTKLWDARTGRLLASLGVDFDLTASAEFSPDSTRVVTANGKGRVFVWDISGESRRQEEIAEAVARLIPYKFVEGRAVPIFSRDAPPAAAKTP